MPNPVNHAIVPVVAMTKFAGLRSLWTMPWSCSSDTAVVIAAAISIACGGASR